MYVELAFSHVKTLAKDRPQTSVHFYDEDKSIWNTEVVRSKKGRVGVIGDDYVVFRGRCGPESFGIQHDPEKVAELRKNWKSRNTELVNS